MIRVSAKDQDNFIRFHLFNKGEGIAPEQVQTLFQKFSRLENAKATRKQKGTGLGLFICKHIVAAHGGEIHVKSEQGEWIEFIFTLPKYRDTE